MAKAMTAEGLELTHVIGPQTRHSYHPAAKQEINRRVDSIAERGRDPVPKQIRFTTWTLRYNNCDWLTVDGLEKHWQRTQVSAAIAEGNRLRVETKNVSALTVTIPAGHCPFDAMERVRVMIDGSELTGSRVPSDRSWRASFHKSGGKWIAGAAPQELAKRHGLQGPIDDAFLGSFLVVRPTGHVANEKVGAWVSAELARFTNEWRRHFRGDARVKDDTAVNADDLARHNLILWGDPESNQVLARMKDRLPIGWDKKTVSAGKTMFDADHHVLLLIYPNPLNPARYVVLNSGFTFREYDYLNNARQVAKLPDWAVIDLKQPRTSRAPGGIAAAGFFGEAWEWK
jgi:hypothetical protein